ncbi:hypothetical protein LMA04_17835 [Pseudescherichia vulneris]|uniref:hypothetical protein n=1 Tax=Pseudescherichia vulneris TaxID=566 RepID=UPI00227A3750|nr:hypothetical protein [Pseudescherichia vulneris]WAH51935.1 hypothetical protein LMA04_17835 [Pseudescherichia vulneris]
MSEFDSKALSLARQVMELTRQKHIGGDVQLLAKIQCLFVEAMEYAAPQSNSPVIPDGWVMLPSEPTHAMMTAWLSEVANFRGHAAGYRAMIAAAPGKEG